MALTIADYPDPRDPANPLPTAYAWLSFLSLDLQSSSGRILFDVHPSEAAWQGQPVGQVSVSLGQGVDGAHFPSLDELMADAEFAEAYSVLGTKLYGAALASVPTFAGATPA